MNKFRITVLLIMLYVFCSSLTAQTMSLPIDSSKYPFIDLSKNRLAIPEGGDSILINKFFAKYDTLLKKKAGQLNIVHIGGSHVQAGIFTDQIRRNINGDMFSAARGFVFPYRVAKTNNPYSYSVAYKGNWQSERCVKRSFDVQLGIGGIAVYTSDADAEISLSLIPKPSIYNNLHGRVRLFGYVRDGADWAVMPVLKVDDGKNRIYYPNYDYVGKSYYTFELNGNYNNLRLYIQQLDTVPHEFVLTGFLVENDEPGVIYSAIGVNGAAVPSYLSCERFAAEMEPIKPDMVVFGIGINDAVPVDFDTEAFKNNYSALIERIKHTSPDCAFVFITNNDSYRRVARNRYRVNSNGLKVQTAMYELALEHQGAIFDQFAVMGGLSSMSRWQTALLAQRDRIHFTANGYILLGDLFYNAFVQYYNEL